MKQIIVMGPTYTSKEMGEIDLKSMRSKTAWRYRQDIFPDPTGFKLRVAAVLASVVKTDHSVYTHRLKLTIFFPEDCKDDNIERYKTAIELKTKRFDIVRPNTPKKPTPAVEPADEADAEKTTQESATEQPSETVVKAKPKKSKKKKK